MTAVHNPEVPEGQEPPSVGGSDQNQNQSPTSGTGSSSDPAPESGARQRIRPTRGHRAVNHEHRTRHPAGRDGTVAPPPAPDSPFPISQNQMASAFLTAISVLMAILVGYFFIQFRREYNMSQLAKLSPSPSPFFKLKSTGAGLSSQQPARKPVPNTKYVKDPGPDPEVLKRKEDEYRRAVENYPQFFKDDPRKFKKDDPRRGVDPEYEQYAQQLQQVLGNLKEAVKKIDESANITEIAGLVKMKPNEKAERTTVKVEKEHHALLEDDDSNTYIGKTEPAPDKEFERTKKYFEEMLKVGEEHDQVKADAENEPEEADLDPDHSQEPTPTANPYDAIMAYRKANAQRDQALVRELEDKMVHGKSGREDWKIIKELSDAKKKRMKLMEQLVRYYFESLRDPEEKKENQEVYGDLGSDDLASFRERLTDTLFGRFVPEGEPDEEADEDDFLDDMEADLAYENGVFDQELGGQVSQDAKELMDEIPEDERKWIYKSLRFERKMEQEIKDRMIREIMEDKKKGDAEKDEEVKEESNSDSDDA